MKIKNYEEAMEYVGRHRDEMLGFIASRSLLADSPEELFAWLGSNANVTDFGRTPDEELWRIFLYHKDQFEKAREIATT